MDARQSHRAIFEYMVLRLKYEYERRAFVNNI